MRGGAERLNSRPHRMAQTNSVPEWVSSPQDRHLLHIFDVENSPSVNPLCFRRTVSDVLLFISNPAKYGS